MQKEKKIAQIVFEIPSEDHQEIKIRALMRNITMKQYIIEAIAKRMLEEDKYKKAL